MRGRSRAILYVSKLDRYFPLTGVITQARATLVHGTCQRRAAACTMSSFSKPVTITGSRPGVETMYFKWVISMPLSISPHKLCWEVSNMFAIKEYLSGRFPAASAKIVGGPSHPGISGRVDFFPANNGVLVVAEVRGLPMKDEACPAEVFAFHIHEGSNCTGNADDPFSNVGAHFNPKSCPHPAHAGDLPPLFGNEGYAFMVVYTDRFSVRDVIGRTIIIHSKPDDFTTQPSGNSGQKIACGQIKDVCCF